MRAYVYMCVNKEGSPDVRSVFCMILIYVQVSRIEKNYFMRANTYMRLRGTPADRICYTATRGRAAKEIVRDFFWTEMHTVETKRNDMAFSRK